MKSTCNKGLTHMQSRESMHLAQQYQQGYLTNIDAENQHEQRKELPKTYPLSYAYPPIDFHEAYMHTRCCTDVNCSLYSSCDSRDNASPHHRCRVLQSTKYVETRMSPNASRRVPGQRGCTSVVMPSPVIRGLSADEEARNQKVGETETTEKLFEIWQCSLCAEVIDSTNDPAKRLPTVPELVALDLMLSLQSSTSSSKLQENTNAFTSASFWGVCRHSTGHGTLDLDRAMCIVSGCPIHAMLSCEKLEVEFK